MREHAEANGLEEAEHLDAHTIESGKTHYHDDSDQVAHTCLQCLTVQHYWGVYEDEPIFTHLFRVPLQDLLE